MLIHGRLLLAGHPWGIDGMSAYDVMAVVQSMLVEFMLTQPLIEGQTAVETVEFYLTEVWGRTSVEDKPASPMDELMEMRRAMGQAPAERLNVPTLAPQRSDEGQ
jgi:hypothetical protein